MHVITARNVHDALPRALQLMDDVGLRRNSRAGEVIKAPGPVATVYQRPWERVLFWPERDANPAFHLYESLWMLAGRQDLEPLVRYVRRFSEFSDDGHTIHDAYGYRWRTQFGLDQLQEVIRRLKANLDDRRCTVQMWDATTDLIRGSYGKAVPCNLIATVQVESAALELVVFCRSNDIVWGTYGANAVHFSMLQEYLAGAIGVPMGDYTQVSVNWHAYTNVYDTLAKLPRPSTYTNINRNPYVVGEVIPTPLWSTDQSIEDVDDMVRALLASSTGGRTLRLPRWHSVCSTRTGSGESLRRRSGTPCRSASSTRSSTAAPGMTGCTRNASG